MNNLCSICMRGGSKGVANKNLKKLNGKPLMAYTIEQAIASQLFNHIIVSTDSEEIRELSFLYGANYIKRPKSLTKNSTSVKEICLDRHLFSGQTYMGAISLNICALIANVTASSWLKDTGILAFSIIDSSLRIKSSEYCIEGTKPIAVR